MCEGGGVKECVCEGGEGVHVCEGGGEDVCVRRGERICAEGRKHEYILARCMGLACVNSTALVHGTQTTHGEQQCLSVRVAERA